MDATGRDGPAQGAAGGHQATLADHFLQGRRTHALGQGTQGLMPGPAEQVGLIGKSG